MKNQHVRQIDQIIKRALKEDIGGGDITTRAIVPSSARGSARAIAKGDFVVAGLTVFRKTFLMLDKRIRCKNLVAEGAEVKKGDVLAHVEGPLASILTAERVALNFLQRMCGIATLTRSFVRAVEGTEARILDTRKTVPGLRVLDKLAVKTGGGCNHRMGLYDAVLIKDNHIAAAGSIAGAVRQAKKILKKKMPIEVETRTLEEVAEALRSGADIIMLDNMSLVNMKKAVALVAGRALLEASGNVSLKNVAKIAQTGVNFISVGQLTHSVVAADISLKVSR